MLFTVAIVGRPNVGKSTLFNRLIKKKHAIVYDKPGVTRDRREGNSVFFDLQLRVIDTAGLDDSNQDDLSLGMQKQTEIAINESDAILFVVDGREGINPIDKYFSQQLRKYEIPVILTVNKCERLADQTSQHDAFSLGFGEPVALSAEHGIGFDELYSALKPLFSSSLGTTFFLGNAFIDANCYS